jgi:hypothetical protein
MRVELSEENFHEAERGVLVAPDGRRYTRRTTRTKRKDADQLVADGFPLVLYYWAGGQLEWFDGADAQLQWKAVRTHVIAGPPRAKGPIEWTAGRWEAEDGSPALILTGHC